MSTEIRKEIQLEIAHVLFIDIIGYSKLSINDQHAAVEELNQMVRASEQFQRAEGANRLIRIPTGDGMVLVFYTSPEAPAQCAVEISRALKEHPRLQLRIGIHSGPVSGVIDVTGRANLAGAGLNIAQRVMECGDAGHILLSKHFAEDLEEYEQWRPLLHDLGTCEVKHGVRVSVTNLYSDEVGNPRLPKKFQALKKHRSHVHWAEAAIALLVLAAVVAAFIFILRKPTRSALSIAEKSIAVLPFENLSEEKANAFFADGVQDAILTNLARIVYLKVISRTSVMQYKSGVARNLREIGQQLGVAHLSEGSMQHAANRVRVNAQLIDTRSDAHLWAQTYDRDLADVFAIQSEIAKAIVEQLQAKLSPTEKLAIAKPPTTDLTAYDLYLRALALYADITDVAHSKVKLPKAAELLNEAVTRDQQFLLAFCLLAKVQTTIYWQGFDHSAARLDLANAAVQSALRLQPDAGEAHLALADYYYRAFREYDKAHVELNLARRTLPNNADVYAYTGYINRRQGRWEEATRDLERAVELDPRNYLILQQLAITYQAQRRYSEQAAVYDRALAIMPGDPVTRMARAQVAFDSHADLGPTREMSARLIAEDPSIAPDIADVFSTLCERNEAAVAHALTSCPPEGTPLNGVTCPCSYWEGAVAFWRRDFAKAQTAFKTARAEVEKILEKQPDFPPALSLLGMIDAGLGRKEEAIREGRRACELMPLTIDALDG